MGALLAMTMVFVGCCANVVFLELLIRAHPGSGNIVTFSQFCVVALEGFVNEMRFGSKRASIPLKWYLGLVAMFLSSNVLNNYALNFDIPLPLHMIFRSGSLIANLLLGILILKRSYQTSKYVAVLMITVGICMATMASTKPSPADSVAPINSTSAAEDSVASPPGHALERFVGIAMLTFALFVSALMGIYQERMYASFGKHPHEALFFAHALPLPAFALLWSNIAAHARMYNASPPLLDAAAWGELGGLVAVPCMWVYLLGNVVTQLMCIKGVYILSSEVSSLVCTLVVTLRKFFSLLFSIFYFQNPFSFYHWVGTVLVFGGTAVFLDIAGMMRGQMAAGGSGGDAAKDREPTNYTQLKKKE